MKPLKLVFLFSALLISTAFAGLEKATQKGIGTIDQYDSHGKTVYRFVPQESEADKLRLVKFIPNRLGFKKGLSEELEKFFAEALKEQKSVEIECEFFDKGIGKKTSIGSKIISFKFVKE